MEWNQSGIQCLSTGWIHAAQVANFDNQRGYAPQKRGEGGWPKRMDYMHSRVLEIPDLGIRLMS